MRQIMNYLFLPCIKATELIEKRELVTLTFAEKIQLNFHLSMCKACRAYQWQSRQLKRALENWISLDKSPDHSLSFECKSKILKNLKKN